METRSYIVGFRRQADFAKAIGCGRTQLAKWLDLQAPPKRMRKGFDKRLASALEVTATVLFKEYLNNPPSQAGFIAELPGPGREPWKNENWSDLEVDKKLGILAYMLGSGGEDVQRLIDFGVALVVAKDSRTGRELAVNETSAHNPIEREFPDFQASIEKHKEAIASIDRTIAKVEKALKNKVAR